MRLAAAERIDAMDLQPYGRAKLMVPSAERCLDLSCEVALAFSSRERVEDADDVFGRF